MEKMACLERFVSHKEKSSVQLPGQSDDRRETLLMSSFKQSPPLNKFFEPTLPDSDEAVGFSSNFLPLKHLIVEPNKRWVHSIQLKDSDPTFHYHQITHQITHMRDTWVTAASASATAAASIESATPSASTPWEAAPARIRAPGSVEVNLQPAASSLTLVCFCRCILQRTFWISLVDRKENIHLFLLA